RNAGRGDHDSARLVASVKGASPEARVIVTDLIPERADICELVRAGASGFLLKGATLDDFVTTIRTVARGERVLPAPLTATLFAHIAEPGVSRSEPAMPTAPTAPTAPKVTKREREMLDLIAEGLSNKAIAQRLSIATNTVKGHVHHLLGKLALRTRLEAAVYARNGDGGAGGRVRDDSVQSFSRQSSSKTPSRKRFSVVAASCENFDQLNNQVAFAP